ncbi:Trypanosomal VSG domain containing protein, putative [Trypanosoma equiperdum]|uniref:Trypanosomal VSG domain containing protein, putative n=1 Tax=Trypanosoma equiperdum TaxID=5694 RepID=A0A1G4I698_TRYEQ|nr:Trypanosomal VSG domain containing protein, putative [Trypanosoma equiperdum]
MIRSIVALGAMWLCTTDWPTYAAQLNANELADDFGALCGAINLALTEPKVPSPPNGVEDLALAVGAINLTLANKSLTDLIDLTKTPDQIADKSTSPKAGNELNKWREHWDFWQKSKKKTAELERQKDYAAWKQAKLSDRSRKTVQANAEVAYKLYEKTKAEKLKLTDKSIKQKLAEALYGSGGTEQRETTYAGAGRATKCGKHDSLSASLAGHSLRFDIQCLCGFAQGDGDAGAACCTKCGATVDGTSLATTAWDAAKDSGKLWKNLKAECQKLNHNLPLSTSSVNAVIRSFYNRLEKKKGDNGAVTLHLLGNTDGTASTGCTGSGDTNGGRCVHYKEDYFAGNKVSVPWISALQTAAAEADGLSKAEAALEAIKLQLETLNATNAALIYDTEINTPSSGDKTPTTATQEQAKAQREAAEKVCNAAGGDQKACENLKDQGCVYKGDGGKDKKCTLSEEGKKEAEKEAAKEGEGDAGATTRCSRHGIDKARCENDKTGDKQNCAFINGNDG